MHSEQNVCEHSVINGALRYSLQTWHRRELSRRWRGGRRVVAQSVGSDSSGVNDIVAGC